jgi:hypothetical protein
MQYENFSRHLREKYSTRLHIADQLVDQLKHNNQSRILPTSVDELNNKNVIKAQQEISFPLISYLNTIECGKLKSIETNKEFQPYFNECLLAAERIKNNRRSDKDRQICYENLILTQKLEDIKKQSGQNSRRNLEKDYQNHCRLLLSKANCGHDALKSINKKFLSSNEKRSSETIVGCYSSLLSKSESEISSSENEEDQATAADVDVSMEYCDSRSPVSRKQRNTFQNNRNFNCAQSKSTKCKENYSSRVFETENDRVYQHLTNIDMTMVRDTMPLPTSPTSRHFSICILPRFDSDSVKPMNNRSKVLSYDRQYAFKKEILYR